MSEQTTPLARATALHRAGRLADAQHEYREILRRTPNHPQALHRLGVLAQQTGDLVAAETLLRRALAADDRPVAVHLSLARVLERAGKIEPARQIVNRVVTDHPDEYAGHYQLGSMHHRAGNLEQALAAYQRARELRPREGRLLVHLGSVCNALGRRREAVGLYREAIELDPNDANAHGNLGNALAGLGEFDQATKALRQCIALDPQNPTARANLGSCHLRQGDFDGARQAFDQCLQGRPGDITALAMRAALLNEAGDSPRRDALLDYDRFVVCEDITTAPGYASVQAWNQALSEQILADPSLQCEPGSHTTMKGEQTGSLLAAPASAVQALEEIIRARVPAGLERLSASTDGTFRRPAPAHWTLDMWGTVLRSDGHQVPHIHPAGWMSGVYYVACPEVDRDVRRAGWIEFGAPPDDFPFTRPPAIRSLAPRPGRLVFFPAYFYHRTQPLGQDGLRISIAFDIVPR